MPQTIDFTRYFIFYLIKPYETVKNHMKDGENGYKSSVLPFSLTILRWLFCTLLDK